MTRNLLSGNLLSPIYSQMTSLSPRSKPVRTPSKSSNISITYGWRGSTCSDTVIGKPNRACTPPSPASPLTMVRSANITPLLPSPGCGCSALLHTRRRTPPSQNSPPPTRGLPIKTRSLFIIQNVRFPATMPAKPGFLPTCDLSLRIRNNPMVHPRCPSRTPDSTRVSAAITT
jgi:hypothetical protein